MGVEEWNRRLKQLERKSARKWKDAIRLWREKRRCKTDMEKIHKVLKVEDSAVASLAEVSSCRSYASLESLSESDGGPNFVVDDCVAHSSNEKVYEKRKKAFARRHTFACQLTRARRTLNEQKCNQSIIDALTGRKSIYDESQDIYRARHTAQLIHKVKKCPEDMSTWKRARFEADSYSASDIRTLMDIIKHGGKSELVYYHDIDPQNRIKRELTKVWGIGSKRADDLVQQGIKSVDDLIKRSHHDKDFYLEERVRRALHHYQDLQHRIPRDEAALIAETVCNAARSAAHQLHLPSTEIIAIAAGSFRRGKSDCGDIDILVSCRTWQDGELYQYEHRATLLDTILEQLGDTDDPERDDGILAAHLTIPPHQRPGRKRTERDNPATYMGICQLSPREKARRLDIKVYHPSQLAFATLYFSGNDYFNRSMRNFAKQCGWSLSDKGFRQRLDNGDDDDYAPYVANCETEKDIFHRLGLQYRAPYERDPLATCDTIEEAEERLVREAAERRRSGAVSILPDLYE